MKENGTPELGPPPPSPNAQEAGLKGGGVRDASYTTTFLQMPLLSLWNFSAPCVAVVFPNASWRLFRLFPPHLPGLGEKECRRKKRPYPLLPSSRHLQHRVGAGEDQRWWAGVLGKLHPDPFAFRLKPREDWVLKNIFIRSLCIKIVSHLVGKAADK